MGKANKIYRALLIALAIILIIAGVFFYITSKAWLLQTNKKELNAQIGKMNLEISINDKTKPKWSETEISVVLDASTKINADAKFNETVFPATIRLKNTELIPMYVTTEITLPNISDNGILYMVLPVKENFPLAKDYKAYIESEIGKKASYSELKDALNTYNLSSLEGYKSNLTSGVFDADSKIISLNGINDDAGGNPDPLSYRDINIIFWAEYDQLLKNNADFNNPKSITDYKHIDGDFSIKTFARQVQDPIFINIPK